MGVDLQTIFTICNLSLTGIFVACYLYQFIYIIVVLLGKKQTSYQVKSDKLNKFGVIVCARNEEAVIGQLLESIKKQDYPAELIKVFLVADNCTDNTAEVGRQHGAIVYERHNLELVGKGYALDFLFEKLLAQKDDCDGYIVFDADNLVDKNFVKEMNINFNRGYVALTSYRNSKNYGTNWITAGYSLWFLREAKYLNNARMRLDTSCAISGTGFCLNRRIIEENGGWKYHLLTEDIEFSTDMAIRGEKIGYSAGSIVYDEQPVTFKQSWNQRLRWAKGFYQILGKYGKSLVKGIFQGSFSCYDMLMTVFPALIFTILTSLISFAQLIYGVTILSDTLTINVFMIHCFVPLFYQFMLIYVFMLAVGFITLVTEWSEIRCTAWRKVFHLFTFPLFMMTYMPIAIAAVFKRVEWTPIAHTVTTTIDDINKTTK